jgi:hypothetical protein
MVERCPFIDPEYELDTDKPCPVCGMFGWPPTDDQDLCVGDVVDTGDELHQILGEAIRRVVGGPRDPA